MNRNKTSRRPLCNALLVICSIAVIIVLATALQPQINVMRNNEDENETIELQDGVPLAAQTVGTDSVKNYVILFTQGAPAGQDQVYITVTPCAGTTTLLLSTNAKPTITKYDYVFVSNGEQVRPISTIPIR